MSNCKKNWCVWSNPTAHNFFVGKYFRIKPLIDQSLPPFSRYLILDLWGHVRPKRRIQFASLVIVMIASGLAELLSLGAVLPFLGLLSDPDGLWKQPLVQNLAGHFSLTTVDQLLLPFTLAFAAAAVMAAMIRLANLWLNSRLAAVVGSDFSCEAYRRTLYQPYKVHVQRNSASVISGTTSQVAQTVLALNSLLQILTSSFVAGGLFLGLFLINPSVAFGASFLFGIAYGFLAVISRKELRRNSKLISESTTLQFKALQEGLGSVRDVLLDGTQSFYVELYRKSDSRQRLLKQKNSFLAACPRYLIEPMGMVGIALLGWIMLSSDSNTAIIPLLGALALGAQRILPALQQIYTGWAVLKGCNAAIQDVLGMLNQPLPPVLDPAKPLQFFEKIQIKNVSFSYGVNLPEVLTDIQLEIRRGERIGFIGSTGSGKSSLIDLVMGLLEPTTGTILIDNSDLNSSNNSYKLASWRASIAHVPQAIFLADSSIAENIAFGIPHHQIDYSRVRLAAQQAQIAGFIENSTHGYDTFVGERGIRMSGGQRQRIGIARALYKSSQVLVLDEATAALDNATEQAVIDSIESLSRDLTIIMIAHRLSTLSRCDRVIRLKEGRIVAQGPPRAFIL